MGVGAQVQRTVDALAARYSQIAWVVARMWSSLNVAVNADPRCPDVPNDTRCAASPGSGCTA